MHWDWGCQPHCRWRHHSAWLLQIRARCRCPPPLLLPLPPLTLPLTLLRAEKEALLLAQPLVLLRAEMEALLQALVLDVPLRLCGDAVP